MARIETSTPPVAPQLPKKEGAKREYEKLIDEICALVYKMRSEGALHLDNMMKKSAENNRAQRHSQFIATAILLTGGVAGLAVSPLASQKETASGCFQVGSKIGELFSGIYSSIGTDYQTEKEQIEHERNQWNTFLGNLQQLATNLETKRQQYEQKQAEVNAVR